MIMAEIGASAFETVYGSGKEMTLHRAVALALDIQI
jgi:hypothetical protein